MGRGKLAPFFPKMEHKDINKIILIGMGSSWKKAPMEGETWGLNALILKRPVKRLFLMHDLDLFLEKDIFQMKEVVEEVNKLGTPVMTLKKYSFLPSSIEYPLSEIHSKYFTNSFAYMIAYAICERATSIDLYGIPLVLKDEYRDQRACVEYWLGYARGKGIEVTIFGGSTLFTHGVHAGLYGYEWNQIYQKIP